MIDKLKLYLVQVAAKKYVPIGIMAGMTYAGTFLAANAGMLEQWGVNYIAQWSPDWLKAHDISGPILLIELDTTNTALIALILAGIAVLSRAGEHHVMTSPALLPGGTNEPK